MLIRGRMSNRPQLSTTSTDSDTVTAGEKFNFTADLTAKQLNFSNYTEHKIEFSNPADVTVQVDIPKPPETEEKETENSTKEHTFKAPRSLIGAVSTCDLDLLNEMLDQQAGEEMSKDKQNQLNHALMLSITMKQAVTVERLLEAGADMHAFDEWYPVLLTAVDIKAMEVFEIMIAKAKNVNVSSNYGNLMHSAARTGDMQLLKRVCELGVDINLHSRFSGTTPLHEAVRSVKFNGKAWLANATKPLNDEHPSVRKRKTASNDLIEQTENAGKSPSCDGQVTDKVDKIEVDSEPVSNYDLTTINFLINNGCDIDAQDSKGRTPLHEASATGNLEVVKCLVDAGAKLNVLDTSSSTPVMSALQKNHFEVVDYLISDEIVNSPVIGGQYLSHLACKSGNHKTVEYLIKKGADMKVKDENDMTPLMVALSHKGGDYCVNVLLEQCDDCGITEVNQNNDTALEILFNHWNLHHLGSANSMLKLMVRKGSDINKVHPSKKETPLLTYIDNDKIADCLVDLGCDVDFVAESGRNALLLACDNNNTHLVERLMNNNISMALSEIVKTEGESPNMTPLQLSIFNQNREVTEMLLCAGCSLRNVHSWMKTSQQCQEALADQQSEFYKSLKYIESLERGPSTLQSLSRQAILKAVGPINCKSRVDKLCLPNMIKCCLPWSNFYDCRKEQLETCFTEIV